MIIGIFSFALVVAIVAIITMLIGFKHLSKEIDGLSEELGCYRARLGSLELYDLSDLENRLDQLEEMLELKEYFEEAPLGEEQRE